MRLIVSDPLVKQDDVIYNDKIRSFEGLCSLTTAMYHIVRIYFDMTKQRF